MWGKTLLTKIENLILDFDGENLNVGKIAQRIHKIFYLKQDKKSESLIEFLIDTDYKCADWK